MVARRDSSYYHDNLNNVYCRVVVRTTHLGGNAEDRTQTRSATNCCTSHYTTHPICMATEWGVDPHPTHAGPIVFKTSLRAAAVTLPYWSVKLDSNQRTPKRRALQAPAIAAMRFTEICMAYPQGFEPWPAVLETDMLTVNTKGIYGADAQGRTETIQRIGRLSKPLRYHYATSALVITILLT